jgi:hypothetical protein
MQFVSHGTLINWWVVLGASFGQFNLIAAQEAAYQGFALPNHMRSRGIFHTQVLGIFALPPLILYLSNTLLKIIIKEHVPLREVAHFSTKLSMAHPQVLFSFHDTNPSQPVSHMEGPK